MKYFNAPLYLIFCLASFLMTTAAQAQVAAATTPVGVIGGQASVVCNLTSSPIPFIFNVNATLRFDGTVIQQDANIWFSADHQYCSIQANANCNILRFFNGTRVNGQLITLPAPVAVRSVVLGVPRVYSFMCQ